MAKAQNGKARPPHPVILSILSSCLKSGPKGGLEALPWDTCGRQCEGAWGPL